MKTLITLFITFATFQVYAGPQVLCHKETGLVKMTVDSETPTVTKYNVENALGRNSQLVVMADHEELARIYIRSENAGYDYYNLGVGETNKGKFGITCTRLQ